MNYFYKCVYLMRNTFGMKPEEIVSFLKKNGKLKEASGPKRGRFGAVDQKRRQFSRHKMRDVTLCPSAPVICSTQTKPKSLCSR